MRKKTVKRTAVQQLNEDLGVSKIGFNCEKCGSNLILDPNHIQSFCQFCGAPLPKADELIRLSYEHMEKNKDREMELKRMEHKTKLQKIKTAYDIIEMIPAVIMIIIVAALIGMMIYMEIK